MNEAWGALLAGIAAAVGGGLGGWLTARAAIRQALTAGREQQRNWLLDKRLAAFTDFLDVHSRFRERLIALAEAQVPPDAWPDDASRPTPVDRAQAFALLYDGREDLARAMRAIELLGPKAIMEPALEAVAQSVEAVIDARLRYESSEPDFPDSEWGAARHAFTIAHGTFVESASQALHSDQI